MVLAKIRAAASATTGAYVLDPEVYRCAIIDDLGNEITITDEMVKCVTAASTPYYWPRQAGTRPAVRAMWAPRVIAGKSCARPAGACTPLTLLKESK